MLRTNSSDGRNYAERDENTIRARAISRNDVIRRIGRYQIFIARHKVVFIRNLPAVRDAPLTLRRLFALLRASRRPDIGPIVSLPGYISSFEAPRPDNTRKNEQDPPPILSLSLFPLSSYVYRRRVHPRRRVKLQILHPFARSNTAALVPRKPLQALPPLPPRRTRRTKGAFKIRQERKVSRV